MAESSEIFIRLYETLRTLARGRLAAEHGANAGRDATSLVHEVYVKLRNWSHGFENETHFLATASSAMRQILVDRARAMRSQKRNAVIEPLTLSLERPHEQGREPVEILLLDEMLHRLHTFDPRAAQIVEMRVFLGLTEEEIARELRISTRTVKRDWSAASAWLKAEIPRHRLALETPRSRPPRQTVH